MRTHTHIGCVFKKHGLFCDSFNVTLQHEQIEIGLRLERRLLQKRARRESAV